MGAPGILSLQVPYRITPVAPESAAVLGASETWMPYLTVSIIIGPFESKRFEAVVDSGSQICLFHAGIGKRLGLKLTEGKQSPLGGVVGGSTGRAYFHKIELRVAGDIIPIVAGFSEHLSVAAILGRHGFFENFTVTFDPCAHPPGLRLERIHRA